MEFSYLSLPFEVRLHIAEKDAQVFSILQCVDKTLMLYVKQKVEWYKLHFSQTRLADITVRKRQDEYVLKKTYKVLPNGVKHGTCKYYFPNGNIESICQYVMGKWEGLRKSFYPESQLFCSQYFKGGKAEGKTKIFYHSGKIKEINICKNGKRNGICKKYYETGVMREQAFYHDNKKIGLCVRWNGDGTILRIVEYKGVTDDFTIDQNITLRAHAGRVFEYIPIDFGGVLNLYKDTILVHTETYKNGVRNGVCTSFYDDGSLLNRCEFLNNKVDGQTINFYKNGGVRCICTYVKGVKEGICVVYYENGVISKIYNYKNGAQHGDFRNYDYNGKLISKFFKNKGIFDGTYEQHKNDIVFIRTYDNGTITCEKILNKTINKVISRKLFFIKRDLSICQEFYSDGTLSSEKFIEISTNNFIFVKKWYPDGKYKSSFTFVDGLPNGKCKIWDLDGNCKELKFLYGKLTK